MSPRAQLKVAFVTRWDESNACWRLQQHAVVRGAKGPGRLHCEVFRTDDLEAIDTFAPDFIGFHFGEGEMDSWRTLHRRFRAARFVCFGSDIYDYGLYTRLEEFTDLFVMPTKLHAQVLAAHVTAPVFHLVEPVDPLIRDGISADRFSRKRGKRVGWFGYAESFSKSMYSLLPLIEEHVQSQSIERFSVLTDPRQFANPSGFEIVPFNPKTFEKDLGAFDYVILSHFPLDLHLNSFIKSPNKLMAALAAGVIPLASDTPSYRQLMEELGLTGLLFGSPIALDMLLKALDPDRDARRIREGPALEVLRTQYSDQRVARDFTAILEFQVHEGHVPRSRLGRQPRPSYAEHVALERRFASRIKSALGRWFD